MAHEHMTKLDEKDVSAASEKAESGLLVKDQVEIESQVIALPHDGFEALADEEEGAEVVLVLKGYVAGHGEDQVFVEFDAASLVHGKMTPGQKKRVMRLEEELGHRPGVKNKFALARHIALRRKGGRY